MKLRIVNIRGGAKCDIRMDRRTPFGNPFPITNCDSRDGVCDKFGAYLDKHPELMEQFSALVDCFSDQDEVTLGCWCTPERCHVESYVNRYQETR